MNPAIIGLLHFDDKGWADYLKKLLLRDNNQCLQVKVLDLAVLVPDNPPEVSEVTTSCMVTILLMTPNMCDNMPGASWLENCFDNIPTHRAIVQLIAFVDDAEIVFIREAFPSSPRWQKMTLSQHTHVNIKMIAEILDLVDKSEKEEKAYKIKSKNPASQVREIFPSTIHYPGEHVAVIMQKSVIGKVQVSFTGCNDKIATKKLNPFTYRFRVPDIIPNMTTLDIFVDAEKVDTKPIEVFKPSQVFESISFLMQSLDVDNEGELDMKLHDMFEKSEPGDTCLSTLFTNLPVSSSTTNQKAGTYPTVLHFAAAHNLKEFTSVLLEAAGVLHAYDIKNEMGQNAADLAEVNGYTDLALYMREFTATKSITDACQMYICMSKFPKVHEVDNNEDIVDTYTPPTRPPRNQKKPALETIPDEKSPPTICRKTSLPPVPTKVLQKLNDGQLVRPQHVRSTSLQETRPNRGPYEADLPVSPEAKQFLNIERELHPSAMGSSSQQELIDIIELVKTKEFTDVDAETSLRAWKERPPSKSFKDRKLELSKMTEGLKESSTGRLYTIRSKRQDKEMWKPVDISSPIQTKISKDRASSLSASSSSTNESRDSCLSSTDNLSENEDDPTPIVTQRRPSVSQSDSRKRVSRKDMFLEKALSLKEEENEPPPPVPPRKPASGKKVLIPVPSRAPQPVIRYTKNY